MEKRKTRIFLGLSILIISLLSYGLIEPYLIETLEVNVTSKDIPESFDGKKRVFISDIHHGPFFSRDRVADIVNRVNALEPDIIILGGDYVYKSPKYIVPAFEELSRLKTPLGIYAVMGNNDHYQDPGLTIEAMQAAGIKDVDNQAYWVVSGDDRIKIGGVGDLMMDEQDIEPTIGDVSKDDYVILVSHNPDYAEQIKTDKVDLVLSGHTHGGQVTFFGLWAPYITSRYGDKYKSGMVNTGYAQVYITKGLGIVDLPFRFFARPEITVINLKKA